MGNQKVRGAIHELDRWACKQKVRGTMGRMEVREKVRGKDGQAKSERDNG